MNRSDKARRHALRLVPPDEPLASPQRPGLEELIEGVVERAVLRALGPYLQKLSSTEPATYTVSQAAAVLQVSNDTIARLVKRGVLAKVPHLDGKTLIPRQAVADLLGRPPASP